jgi:hypothetical protein
MLVLLARPHLFEIHEQDWAPAWLRHYSTDYLETLFRRLGIYRRAAPLLAELVRRSGERTIVDLCSGAGGPLPVLASSLVGELGEVEIVLTDKFPNRDAFARLERRHGGVIRHVSQPVDARRVPAELRGVRTLFDALHHFDPDEARAILADARDAAVSIAVFEAVSRRPAGVAGALLVPALVLGLTPWVQPFRWRRLLFTYLIPLLPLAIGWDGLVSHLRAYSRDELETLARELTVDRYRFEVGELPVGPARLTYVLGYAEPAPRGDE